MSISRLHAAASAAHNDAPRIGERAATGGRSAIDGVDERAGAKRRYPFALGLTNRIERREPRRVGASYRAEGTATLPHAVCGQFPSAP
jgi:hypothetical protein